MTIEFGTTRSSIPAYKIAITSVILGLILSACIPATTKNDAGQINVPGWVTEPPKDDPASLWGVGEGPAIDGAKQNALKNIAAKLRVTISGQAESQTTVSNNSVDRFARTKVKEEVQKTEFKNHAIEKTARSGSQGYFVLVRVDRRMFVSDAEQKLLAAQKEIDNILAPIESAHPLEQFIAWQKAQPWLEKAVASSQILSAVAPSFDGNRLRNLESSLDKAQTAASRLSLDLMASNDGQDVALTIRAFLNDSGMRIGKGINSVPVVIQVTESQDTAFKAKMAKLKISLSVLDPKGSAVASREYVVAGSSVVDYKQARQAALKKLDETIRVTGPMEALGFKP